jgi:hypothetical protein
MRKSFIALALLVGAIAMLTTSAFAQLERDELGLKLSNAKIAQMQMSKASRLGTASEMYDTLFVGHSTAAATGTNPFSVGSSTQYRPTLSHEGIWDFDHVSGGAEDSLEGWFPFPGFCTSRVTNTADYTRPWYCLDFGNRLNAAPVQGRTTGVISAWHVDAGANQAPVGQDAAATPWWLPLSGSASAWCGLRAGKDLAYVDQALYGGTGNPYNGDVLWGTQDVNVGTGIRRVMPGFVSRWDQMLYRDVRVAEGQSLTLSFLYQNKTGPELATTIDACTGWFNLDPMSLTEGTLPYPSLPVNFISSYNTGRTAPIDSFMVYVGVPTDPTGFTRSDGAVVPIFDLKRRWFSEVIAIDKPYKEVLSTWGWDSVYKATPLVVTVTSEELAPMLTGQGAADGGGVIRVVFRSKTNRNSSDEDAITVNGAGSSFGEGAVRIDDVKISLDGGSNWVVDNGFETAAEIDNNIESANSDLPGPAVGEGYALDAWHSTGKPPRPLSHTHPIYQTDISNVPGVPNVYDALYWTDICGPPNSAARICNLEGVVVSTGDHDYEERTSGLAGTAFRSNLHGMMSPTINLVVPETGDNEMGIDKVHKETPNGWFFRHDAMLGVFSIPGENCAWQIDLFCYPVLDAHGCEVWSDAFNTGFISYNPDKQCYWMDDDLSSLIFTTHESGLPDSIKIGLYKYTYCSSWGGAPLCASPDGHYVDNMAFWMAPAGGGASDKIQVDLWDWYQDAFPANESTGYPGNAALFDTCAAHIMTALNESQTTGDELRFNIPGDSITCLIANATNTPVRLDCVFRIYPGPGNYVTIGDKSSGLRAIPTDPAPASTGTTGASAFWKSYLADPGPFSNGNHVGGWNPNTWNSVRCDTAEFNMFPMDGVIENVPGLDETIWQTTIHEDDPNYAALGISKPRCFPTQLIRDLTSDNTQCGTAPDWVLADPTGVGYDGNPYTIELTKIFPDGLFTPGTHFEYFLRLSHIGSEADFVMLPDTNLICPQPNEGPSWDAHRWQEFAVLPDRWKSSAYGGIGDACMLVVDGNDRRGNERTFVGLADSIGLTTAAKYGSHNGWHCDASYVAPDGSHDYWGENVGTNDAICVRDHKGQAGSLWDFYQIKGAESGTSVACRLGGRLANRDAMGYAEGKTGRQGPTPDMLRAYYKLVFYFSGDLNTPIFGDAYTADMSSNDCALMIDFLSYNADVDNPRGFWEIGNGFMESFYNYNWEYELLTDYCGTFLRDKSYYQLSGSNLTVKLTDLTPTSVITTGGEVYATQNLCTFTNDVHELTGVPGVVPGSYYQDMGTNGPYISGAYGPSVVGHEWVTLIDGWEIDRMLSAGSPTDGSQSDVGRLLYVAQVLSNGFASVCGMSLTPSVDVPTNTIRNIDFLGNVWGNPMMAGGKATVHFGLAKADRVEIKVYDVTGRLVKTLANRDFPGGEHTLVWDGTNDQGRTVARGVYFTQVKYVNSRFVDAKKVTVLK